MNKQKILKILNPLLMLSMLLQIITIVLVNVGVDAMEIHEINGYCLIVLAIFHLILNWAWVAANFKLKKR